MYLESLLVFKSYVPLKLEKGMLFVTYTNGRNVVRELTSIPEDEEKWIVENGHPVEMYIVDMGNPNKGDNIVIATPDQIGWFDEGDHTDEMSDITIANINHILQYYEGWVDVEMTEDGEGDYIPLLYEGKITIRLPQEFEQDDEEAYSDWEENNNTCNVCKGTGEGSYDGSSCTHCGGTGRGRKQYF